MDHETLVKNIVTVCKLAKGFNVPIVLTTVNVESGINQPLFRARKTDEAPFYKLYPYNEGETFLYAVIPSEIKLLFCIARGKLKFDTDRQNIERFLSKVFPTFGYTKNLIDDD